MEKRKKYNKYIYLLLIVGFICIGGKAEATSVPPDISDRTTLNNNVGITFIKEEKPIVEPPIIQKPIGVTPVDRGKLPSTGELITSLIWMLTGFSLLIVCLGIHSLKRMMLKIA